MEEKKRFEGLDFMALWKNKGQGWGGNLGGLRVLMFENTKKKNPAEPDYRLYVVKNEKRPETGVAQGDVTGVIEANAREPGADDDSPF